MGWGEDDEGINSPRKREPLGANRLDRLAQVLFEEEETPSLPPEMVEKNGLQYWRPEYILKAISEGDGTQVVCPNCGKATMVFRTHLGCGCVFDSSGKFDPEATYLHFKEVEKWKKGEEEKKQTLALRRKVKEAFGFEASYIEKIDFQGNRVVVFTDNPGVLIGRGGSIVKAASQRLGQRIDIRRL